MSILGMWWEYRGHHGQPCLGCGLTMKGFRSDDLLCVNPFALDLSPLRKFIAKRESEHRSFFEGAQWDDAESRQQAFYGALPPKSEVVVSSERFIWLTSDGLYSSDGSTVSRMGIPPEPSPLDKALSLPCKFCGTMVHASKWCQCDAQQQALKRWDALYAKGLPSASDLAASALEDFVARRKAKREAPDPGKPYNDSPSSFKRHVAERTLDRAMSLPLSFTARMGMRY